MRPSPNCGDSVVTPTCSAKQTTYYTELGLVLARSLIEKGDLDVEDFQTKVLATFGACRAKHAFVPARTPFLSVRHRSGWRVHGVHAQRAEGLHRKDDS